MIYVLYDKPKELEDMSFLTAAFEREYEEIYPEWRCTSIKRILSVCSAAVSRAKKMTLSYAGMILWGCFAGGLAS